MKYIFDHDSISFVITKGRVESKTIATCVFLQSDLQCLFKVEIICKKADDNNIQVQSISLEQKDYKIQNFHTYLEGYFGLPASVSLKHALSEISVSLTRGVHLFDPPSVDLPDKWVEFSNAIYTWVQDKIIPVVQKEIDIYQTFFAKRDMQ